VIKSKPTQKVKHANSILEYFEYFCQMSSKPILTILTYTVSKFAHFLRHSVVGRVLNLALSRDGFLSVPTCNRHLW